jgi:hypothetical protein
VTTTKRYDTRTDPEAQSAYAALRVLLDRFEELQCRSDRESPAVGRLWGVTRNLRQALDSADRELGESE